MPRFPLSRRPRRRAARKARKARPSVKQVVRKEIQRMAEDKTVMLQVTNQLHNSSITSGDCYALMPPVPQGTDDWNRVGDKLRPKWLRVKGYVSLDFDVVHNTPALSPSGRGDPIYVRVIAFTQNNVKSGGITLVQPSLLFRGPAGSAVSFTGGPYDLLNDINTDLFKVLLDKRVELIPQVQNSYTAPLPHGATHFFTFKIKCPAVLKYDNSSNNFPNNFNPIIACGYGYTNLTPPDTTATPVTFTCTSTLCFEDM